MNLKVNRCCCMSLRTAGLVLGWLGIVFPTLAIVLNIIAIILVLNSNKIHSSTQNSIEDRLAISIATSLLSILINRLLIKGIYANKHRFLLPWLILKGIGMMVGGILVVVFFVYSLVMIASEPALLVMDVIFVFFYGLGCWAWIAVYSLYQEIRMAAERKPLPFNESGQVETASPYERIDDK